MVFSDAIFSIFFYQKGVTKEEGRDKGERECQFIPHHLSFTMTVGGTKIDLVIISHYSMCIYQIVMKHS